MSEIEVWKYQLRSVAGLNAASEKRDHEGALIRVDGGVGCIHPWPSLGDDSLAQQLHWLARGESSPLIAQALRCAAADGAARRAGASLFQHEIPESCWLILPADEPEIARVEGFSKAKLKIGRDLDLERLIIERWLEAGFELRLDANETLSIATVIDFWTRLKTYREGIELFEDPTPWNENDWRVLREIGIPLASDREVETRYSGSEIAVVKPATSDWTPNSGAPFVVTSYMDHAIGQMWAAVEASRLAADGLPLMDCGLLTHRCFEPDGFFEQVRTRGTRLLAPEGTGLGFDETLASLPWEPLT